ncbi:MAG: carboxynorspermidine decarboxylase [Paludibacteraceae bacterium]|nr:carboxynorspermidine decarboxylase [Paludibacteraceae bacterium]
MFIDYESLPSPCYVVDESRLRRNLSLIHSVEERAGVKIIMAFKAFALWKVFPIIREYGFSTTASSLSEARLAVDEMHSLAHTYAPVYTDREFPEIAACSSHITFNSVAQYQRFSALAKSAGHPISCGIRVNPGYSPVETALYNPCGPGSRLGVTAQNLGGTLPEGIEGLHCHNLCESTSYELEKTMQILERDFAKQLQMVKWVNFGGGHLMTRADYDVEHLVSILKAFRSRHPHLQVILEPGSAFAWQTGELVATVEDIVENGGVSTAMLDVSFACHMPDCLEMPYQPNIIGASSQAEDGLPTYRLGGNSCLSGDFYGDWSFVKPLKVGSRVVFLDMIHYTTVKTTMFNGISHPSLALQRMDGSVEILRKYAYEDYKSRMA